MCIDSKEGEPMEEDYKDLETDKNQGKYRIVFQCGFSLDEKE